MGTPDDRRKESGLSIFGDALRSAGPLLGAGIQLAAAVAIMFFAGRGADDLLGTAPWLMIAGTFIGLAAGLYSFIRNISRMDSEAGKEPGEKR